jgi:hypothetical protein
MKFVQDKNTMARLHSGMEEALNQVERAVEYARKQAKRDPTRYAGHQIAMEFSWIAGYRAARRDAKARGSKP